MQQRNYQFMDRIAGMSLLEVMLAITIMSLLTSTSVYHWGVYQQKLKLDVVSSQLMTFLTRVQFVANWTNNSYQLQTYVDHDRVRLKVINSENLQTVAGFDFSSSEKSVHLQPFELLAPMVFYGRRNMAGPGHFIVSNDQGRVKVIISARGRVRRCLDLQAAEHRSVMGIAPC